MRPPSSEVVIGAHPVREGTIPKWNWAFRATSSLRGAGFLRLSFCQLLECSLHNSR